MIGKKVKFKKGTLQLEGVVKSYSMDDLCRVVYLDINTQFGCFKVYVEDVVSVY